MENIEIGAKPLLYPMPAALVGANVQGKPNFITIAYCGIVCPKPPVVSVAMNNIHYANSGIKENGTFSVNIPSVQMAVVTDYCGIFSGHKVDKSRLFDTFYGKLGIAPMIRESPLNLECKLTQVHQLGNHDVFWGEIIAV